MGTRADFYVGRGKDAEWIGSIAWDGYPDGICPHVLHAQRESNFRDRVAELLADRDDGTAPGMGWPWPWDDSATTDYAYAFDGGMVHASCFGGAWFDPKPVAKDPSAYDRVSGPSATFPDMSARKATTFGRRSGLIIL